MLVFLMLVAIFVLHMHFSSADRPSSYETPYMAIDNIAGSRELG